MRSRPLAFAALVVWLGYLLFAASWLMSNPPFAAPDEQQHYIRALAVAHGQFVGKDVPLDRSGFAQLDAKARARAEWSGASTRSFLVGTKQVSPLLRCDVTGPGPFRCTSRTLSGDDVRLRSSVGTYPPVPYVAPGLAARLGSSSVDGLRIGRAAGALVAALLLLLGLLASSDSRTALAASAFAVTPMVVFSMSSLNTSSLEVASGFAFAATGFRLIRSRLRPGWWWAWMGLSGAVLALSRSAGFLWLLLIAALLVLTEPRLLRSRTGLGGLAVTAVGLIGSILWSTAEEPSLPARLAGFSSHLHSAVSALPSLLKGSVGNFGYLNVPLPGPEVGVWLLGVLVLLVAAAIGAGRWGRAVLVAAVAAAVVIPVAFDTLFYAKTGFAPQARHFLPLWVSVPLLAGHLLEPASGRRESRLVFAFAAAALPVLQVLAWYANTKHWVVGASGGNLFSHPHGWTPPLGVAPWLVLALLGAVALAAGYGLSAWRAAEPVAAPLDSRSPAA